MHASGEEPELLPISGSVMMFDMDRERLTVELDRNGAVLGAIA
jgi:hypothetical protein